MIKCVGTVVGTTKGKTNNDKPFTTVQVLSQQNGASDYHEFRDYEIREYKLNDKIECPVSISGFSTRSGATVIMLTRSD